MCQDSIVSSDKRYYVYAKTVKELCIRKPKDPPTIHVIGRLIDLMLGKTILPKYGDPRNLVVIVLINNISIPNTLIDQGEAINIMTKEIFYSLRLTSRSTPAIVELSA